MAEELDVKGLTCPLPVLRVKKRMRDLAAGSELRVLATDPGAPRDIEAFCSAAGHAVLGACEEGGVFVIDIRRGA
ncbi:MAG: sulfurtransferase TusA family protein [Alphaproteobacteria bacterium]